MNKFKTPVSMEVTVEQYENDLKEPLEKLGYKWGSCNTMEKDIEQGYDFLATNYGRSHKKIGGVSREAAGVLLKVLKTYNPKLFLALAAMTTGDDWVVGEYLKVTSNREDNGEIFQVKMTTGYSWRAGNAAISAKHLYTKATKEEIVEYFSTKPAETTIKEKKVKQSQSAFNPGNWCIKQNTHQDVCDWFNNKYDTKVAHLEGTCTYIYPEIDGYNIDDHIPKGYREIQLNEFYDITGSEKSAPTEQGIKRIDDPTLKVGDKVLGFVYEDGYITAMDECIDKIGVVTRIGKNNPKIQLKFKNGDLWCYSDKYPDRPKEKEVEMFPEGSYVVMLSGLNKDGSSCWESMPINHCYKLTRDSYNDKRGFSAEKCSSDRSGPNGWRRLPKLQSTGAWPVLRKATKEEITKYKELDKPYDISILQEKNIKDVNNWYCKVTEDNLDLAEEWQRLQSDFDLSRFKGIRPGNFILSKHTSDNSYYSTHPDGPARAALGGIGYKEITTSQLQQKVNEKKGVEIVDLHKLDQSVYEQILDPYAYLDNSSSSLVDRLKPLVHENNLRLYKETHGSIRKQESNTRVKPLPIIEVKKRF